MTKTPAFIRHSSDQDLGNSLNSLIYLRMIMIAVAALSLLIWHFTVEPFTYWVATTCGLGLVLCWSVRCLQSQIIQPSVNWLHFEIVLDYCWVLLIVGLSGRSANPFIYYYLVLTALSAALLSSNRAWLMCTIGIGLYSALLIFDMQKHFGHFSSDYQFHLVGMWLNFVGSTVVICLFVTKLIQTLRNQHVEMTQTREQALKNEQLIGMATVSASTVHNLATPLSTITVLVEELANHPDLHQDTVQDLDLIRQQISRCRSAMDELSYLANQSDKHVDMAVSQFIGQLENHYSLHYPKHQPTFGLHNCGDLIISISPLFQYAVINLINNALDSSPDQTVIDCELQETHLVISITNKSQMSRSELTQRWGKPTTSTKNTGLGIGSFLANSTIERQGGTVEIHIEETQEARLKTQITVDIHIPAANH